MKLKILFCTIVFALALQTLYAKEFEDDILLTDEQMLTNIKRSLDDGEDETDREEIFVNYGLGNKGGQLKSQFEPSPTQVGIKESLEKYKNNTPRFNSDLHILIHRVFIFPK